MHAISATGFMNANLLIYTLAPHRMHMDPACGAQLRVTSITRADLSQRQLNLPSKYEISTPTKHQAIWTVPFLDRTLSLEWSHGPSPSARIYCSDDRSRPIDTISRHTTASLR
jgi:hypothetical protein